MTDIILSIARAVFVVMFGMNVAVICTWVDRRQGAMIQDRVGPDRAVIWLPTWLARPLVVAPTSRRNAIWMLVPPAVRVFEHDKSFSLAMVQFDAIESTPGVA